MPSAPSTLPHLCRQNGITTEYEESGAVRPVPEESLRTLLQSLGGTSAAPVAATAPQPEMPQVPAGLSCFQPAWLERSPAWGLTCQLYELRSARNWGIGDFRDLRDLAALAGEVGADFLGVNPLHALFLADPLRCSPFSPSNRRFLNPLYIAVDEVPGADTPSETMLAELRAGEMVDYPAVADLKLGALRSAFDRCPFGSDPQAEAALGAFREAGGSSLWRHALFEVLSREMVARGHGAGWTDWPEAMQDWQGEAVARFAADHESDVAFQIWLQWIASLQLSAAKEATHAAGMRIGLYLDLAVGEAPDGSAAWSHPELLLPGVGLGAPPDVFATEGQSWGLAAPSPRALIERDFAPYRNMIAAQMGYAGALRIDHAMALWQLFLVPEGQSARAGAHLRYPFAEMLRVLAEQSEEHGTTVIGEDLGFVPAGFREAMAEAGVLSYRILYFEKMDGAFLPPERYPALALACLSTHDLPTLAAWWRADDVVLRRTHGLVDEASSVEQLALRARERTALTQSLVAAGLLRSPPAETTELADELLEAAHRFIARTPCRLTAVRLADLIGPIAPTNLPGTVNAYPNWRLRCPVPLERLPDDARFLRVTAAMSAERPRGTHDARLRRSTPVARG
ncbi:4-alpha-glucanotransferase [Rubellimicrobium arenae]|uniref:4-alpha-glucanotransferase n=1 Tax=Rubellimicrobium arenae TaxID=2817372 RepID=UPI001B3029CF|nr:4-alpha-glucanotransferase [Rubellimicrobium arenae]